MTVTSAAGDPLDRGAAQRPGHFLYAESYRCGELSGMALNDWGDGVGIGDMVVFEA